MEEKRKQALKAEFYSLNLPTRLQQREIMKLKLLQRGYIRPQ